MSGVVSVTNGDAGHQTEGGGALRRAAAREARRRGAGIGIAIRRARQPRRRAPADARSRARRSSAQIRQWNADLVLAPRPNDYHPDHRYTGVLVQDAAYMVVVPNITPDTPPLRKNPVFMYFEDGFQKPQAVQAGRRRVAIDEVFDKKSTCWTRTVPVLRMAAVGRR